MSVGFFVFLFTVLEVMAIVSTVKTVGFLGTILLMIVAAMVGSALLRAQGLLTLQRFVGRLQDGEPPVEETWDGLCIMLAALLFIIPGVFSDVLALLLLVPFVRAALYRVMKGTSWGRSSYMMSEEAIPDVKTRAHGPAVRVTEVIDAEWHEGPRA